MMDYEFGEKIDKAVWAWINTSPKMELKNANFRDLAVLICKVLNNESLPEPTPQDASLLSTGENYGKAFMESKENPFSHLRTTSEAQVLRPSDSNQQLANLRRLQNETR